MSATHIRTILDLLTEAELSTKSKTKAAQFADATSKGALAAAKPKGKAMSPVKLGRNVGADDEMMRRASAKLDPAAGDVMRRVRDQIPIDVDDDDFGAFGAGGEEPPEHTTLPATTGGLPAVLGSLNWHAVTSLPGYRMWIGYFKDLFNNVFGMDEKKIKVATSLTSSEDDMKNLMGYIHKHGNKQDDFELEMFNLPREMFHISQGYVYHLDGDAFLVLEEKLGQSTNYYVYTAPNEGKSTMKLGVERPALR